MISLKEYAKKKGITYEAVRKQVVRYKEELGEHLFKNNNTQFLDEEGEAFLDQKRAASPVVVINESKDDEISRLKEENEVLQRKITAQANRIAELADWKAEKALLIARAEQETLMLEEKTKLAVTTAVQEAKFEAENEKKEAIRQAEDSIKNKLQEEFNQELAAVKAELEAEKQKTWLQKLLGR